MLPFRMISPHRSRRTPLSRHRDQNRVTATPLESSLTNCDARNSFIIRFYENCRVSLPKVLSLSATLFPVQPICFQAIAHSFALFCTREKLNSFLFRRFRTLSQKHRGWRTPFFQFSVTESYNCGFPTQRRDRFHVGRLCIHRHRSLDQVNRDHYPEFPLPLQQYPLHPRQRPALQPHPPADCQERVRLRSHAARQALFQPFDFFVRQRRQLPVETDETNDAWNLQHTQPINRRHAHKYVTREEWHLQLHPPIFPAPHSFIDRKKRFDGPLFYLVTHPFFVISTGIGCIPAQLQGIRGQNPPIS